MRLVWGLDEVVSDYVALQFPIAQARGGFNAWKAVGVADDSGLLVGGLVATEYVVHDCKLSIFMSRPDAMRPALLRELFGWAFGEAGLRRITAEIAKRNRQARRYVEHLGFRLEGTLRYGWHDGIDDMTIYGMTGDRCRWLETK